ncbi:unnamed protein product, partial [Notodromas monacha]
MHPYAQAPVIGTSVWGLPPNSSSASDLRLQPSSTAPSGLHLTMPSSAAALHGNGSAAPGNNGGMASPPGVTGGSVGLQPASKKPRLSNFTPMSPSGTGGGMPPGSGALELGGAGGGGGGGTPTMLHNQSN